MKYLSTFRIFESLTPPEQLELQEFCKDYLIQLYDNGYKVEFTTAPRSNHQIDVNRMFITVTNNDNYKPLYAWSKVKDQLIPFIDILNDDYELGNFGVSGRKEVTNASIKFVMARKDQFFTPEEIITDGHKLRLNIKGITIMIIGKK